MTKFFNVLRNKLTIGFLLGALLSFIFAVILKFFLDYYFEINPLKGGLSGIDISFFTIIVLFRLIINAFLEYLLEDKFVATIGDIPHSFNTSTLNMDNKTGKSSSGTGKSSSRAGKSHSGTGKYSSGAGKSSSSNLGKSSSNVESSSSNTLSSQLSVDDLLKLRDDMSKNVQYQWDMINRLRDFKESKDIKLYLDSAGNLEADVPGHATDEEVKAISKELSIIDRIINTKFSEYNKLLGKDLMSNNSTFSKSFEGTKKLCDDRYKSLFEK